MHRVKSIAQALDYLAIIISIFVEELVNKNLDLFLYKLLPVILVALFGVAIMLIFIGYGEMMKVIMGEANQFAATIKQITEALAGIQGTIKPPT